MLTAAERNSLALTLGFLLLGAGLKLWTRAHAEVGPFAAEAPDSLAAPRPASGDASAGAAAGPEAADTGASAMGPESGEGRDHRADPGAAAMGPAEAAPVDRAGGAPDPGPGPAAAHPAGRAAPRAPGPGAAERTTKRKAPPAGKVDANRASAEALTAVPGIGPKLAAAIVAYRSEHGPFRDLAQLRGVKGIGKKKWAAIVPCLALTAAADGGEKEGGKGGGEPP